MKRILSAVLPRLEQLGKLNSSLGTQVEKRKIFTLSEEYFEEELQRFEDALLFRDASTAREIFDRFVSTFELDVSRSKVEPDAEEPVQWKLQCVSLVIQGMLVGELRLRDIDGEKFNSLDYTARILSVLTHLCTVSKSTTKVKEVSIFDAAEDSFVLVDWLACNSNLTMIGVISGILSNLHRLTRLNGTEDDFEAQQIIEQWLEASGREIILLFTFLSDPETIPAQSNPLFGRLTQVCHSLEKILVREVGSIQDFPELHTLSPDVVSELISWNTLLAPTLRNVPY